MLRFTLNVVNAKKLDLAFSGLIANIRDWRTLWPQVINQIVKIEEKQFSTMGALGEHGEWAPLTPDYAAAKARQYGGKPILQASERLRDSLVGHTGDTIEELGPLKMRFGSSVEYALYHQTGTRRGLPARRIFDFTGEDRGIVQKQIQREAINFSRRLGFAIAARAGFGAVSAAEARRIGTSFLTEGRSISELGTSLSGGL